MLDVILDIETAPIDGVETKLPDMRPRKGTKDEAKQLAQVAEKRQALLEDAGLDPDLSRIVCLGVDVGHGPEITLCPTEADERDALLIFWDRLRRAMGDYRVITFNGLSFDLPRLFRRSLYLTVPAVGMTRDKYRHPQILDLCDLLSESDRLPRRSLDYYCRRLALDVPCDTIDGSAIAGLVATGDWAAVAAHNRSDLVKTRALAERLGLIGAGAVVDKSVPV